MAAADTLPGRVAAAKLQGSLPSSTPKTSVLAPVPSPHPSTALTFTTHPAPASKSRGRAALGERVRVRGHRAEYSAPGVQVKFGGGGALTPPPAPMPPTPSGSAPSAAAPASPTRPRDPHGTHPTATALQAATVPQGSVRTSTSPTSKGGPATALPAPTFSPIRSALPGAAGLLAKKGAFWGSQVFVSGAAR